MHSEVSLLNLIRPVALALLLVVLLLGPVLAPAQEDRAHTENEPSSAQESDEGDKRRVRRLGDVAADEWEMDLSMPDSPALDSESSFEFDLPDAEQNARLQHLLSTLAARPGNNAALAQLDQFLGTVLTKALAHAEQHQLDEMQQLLGVIRNVNPKKSGLEEAFQKLRILRNIDHWLAAASVAMEAGRIIEPERDSAAYFLQQVLSVEPDNQPAIGALLSAQRILIDRGLRSAQELDFELAEEWLYEASLIREPQDLVAEARAQVAAFQARQADKIEQDILHAIVEQNFEHAEFVLIDLIALGGNESRIKQLRERLQIARIYGQYSPGQVIHDPFRGAAGTAPAVVVIEAGSFLMGSPTREEGRKDNEGPQHRVTLARGFAMGIKEVTVDQFRQFIESSRYRTQAKKTGSSKVYNERSGRMTDRDGINWRHDFEGKDADGSDPVLHVSWYDAQAYVKWLSEQTGRTYRLPTEAEFEYAIRAGSVTRYWWGENRPTSLVENLTGAEDTSRGGRHWSRGFRRYDDGYWGPAPGAPFQANSLGLYDMAGNVSEWVEDCWHQTYALAPADGSAWVNPGCERKVVRGGFWASAPEQARSASRISASVNLHGPRVGIRIARDL